MIISKVNEAASKTSFFIIYNHFHNANRLFQYSHTSRTIASSQHHPRETRPLLSQLNIYENCYIGLVHVEFASYITRNTSNYWLTQFYIGSYFVSLSFILLLYMKLFFNYWLTFFFSFCIFTLYIYIIPKTSMKWYQCICFFVVHYYVAGLFSLLFVS